MYCAHCRNKLDRINTWRGSNGDPFCSEFCAEEKQPIVLRHGWVKYTDCCNVGDPQVAFDPNTSIVYLRGGIEGGNSTSMSAFRLAPIYRPTRDVFIATNLLLGKA